MTFSRQAISQRPVASHSIRLPANAAVARAFGRRSGWSRQCFLVERYWHFVGQPMSSVPLKCIRIPVECPNCGDVFLYCLSDLIANKSTACLRCYKPLDLSTDQWRDALEDTADYYKGMPIR